MLTDKPKSSTTAGADDIVCVWLTILLFWAVSASMRAETPRSSGAIDPYHEGWINEIIRYVPTSGPSDGVQQSRLVRYKFPNRGVNAVQWSGMWLNSYRNAQLYYWDGAKWRLVSYQPASRSAVLTTVLDLDKRLPDLHVAFFAPPVETGRCHLAPIDLADLHSLANEELVPLKILTAGEDPMIEKMPGAIDHSLFGRLDNGGNSHVCQTFVAEAGEIKGISFRHQCRADWSLLLRIREGNSRGRIIAEVRKVVSKPRSGPATAEVSLANCHVVRGARYLIELSCVGNGDSTFPVCVGVRYDNPYRDGFCFWLSPEQGGTAPAAAFSGAGDLALGIYYTTGETSTVARVDFDIKKYEESLRRHRQQITILPKTITTPEMHKTEQEGEGH